MNINSLHTFILSFMHQADINSVLCTGKNPALEEPIMWQWR